MAKRKLTAEQKTKRRDAEFRKKIRNIFVNSGFCHLNTLNKHVKIGHRDIEIDAVFFYHNVMLICEDTGAKTKIKEHIRKKVEAFTEIEQNFDNYLGWLRATFTDYSEQLQIYEPCKYKVFNLYFSQYELSLTNDDRSLYKNVKFVEPQTINYFHRIAQCIKLSSRYEIFRFLGLKKEQVGLSSSDSAKKVIKAPIIYPRNSVGAYNGVRIVSFMMSADLLLNTCYVMRKDNWEESIRLYQRLIDREKIRRIRDFLAKNGESFYNNIIVGLPNDVRFIDAAGESLPIDKIGDFENCKLEINDEWNSICVIDGQHRIFAHYEGPTGDAYEPRISQLRKQLHLLVTGLIFPPKMSAIERSQIQSQIFLDINSNAKPVPPDVLLHIEMIKNPISDVGLARRIIERLNREDVFLNMFELSLVDESKIKVASIVKFALRYLVTITPSEDKISLFSTWEGDKDGLIHMDEVALHEYTCYCSNCLRVYFESVRKRFKKEWDDPSSKILSVTSINGFIIAYSRQLKDNGIRNFAFYDERLKNLNVDFSKENFMYTSSQYRKFSDKILSDAFGL